ncbi:MAG: HipA domain-containing protein [Coriobacteriia bacterium]|nr:HipA domain-containing protein [Coriobacteriia bacterium]
MASLKVERYYQGSFELIGRLESSSAYDISFHYDEQYRADSNAVPLSLSLPLAKSSYSIDETLPFFEGLLPEGQALENLAYGLGISPLNIMDLLHAVGRETVGAIRIGLAHDFDLEQSAYIPLTEDDIEQLSDKSGVAAPLLLRRAKLSLAGAQSKIGLYILTKHDGEKAFYLPNGVAASTHIIKVDSDKYYDLVPNEWYCNSLARACGLDVPVIEIINTSRPMLAIKRFDRTMKSDSPYFNGLPSPIRLHQEDFSQALGINRVMKYEMGDNDYRQMVSALIREYSASPLHDIEALAMLGCFDFLIGNCDNHLKNISIIYSEDYQKIRLAPFYDLLSTTVYELDREMGMRIGSTRNIDQVERNDFTLMGSSLGISRKRMFNLLDEMRERLNLAIAGDATDELSNIQSSESQVIKEIRQGTLRRISMVG